MEGIPPEWQIPSRPVRTEFRNHGLQQFPYLRVMQQQVADYFTFLVYPFFLYLRGTIEYSFIDQSLYCASRPRD